MAKLRGYILHFLIIALLFLFLINTFNGINPIIYPTQDRITYYTKYPFYLTGSIQNDLLLTTIAGLSFLILAEVIRRRTTIIISVTSFSATLCIILFLPVIINYLAIEQIPLVLILTLMKAKQSKIKLVHLTTLIWIFSACWIVVEATSLLYSVSESVQKQQDGNLSLSSYEVLFYGISILKAPIALALIFSFLIRNLRGIKAWKLASYDFTSKSLFSTKVSVIIIIISIGLSLLFMYIPYSMAINPDQKSVSVDENDYLQRLGQLDSLDRSNEIATQIFVQNGERPLFVALLYGLKLLLPDLTNLQILRLVPYLIWPGFLASIFYVTYRLTTNRDIAILAVLLTSISSQSLIMVYGGFFANFLALSIAYFVLLQVYNIWKQGISFKQIVITIAVITVLLFTHVYTWTWVIGVMIVFGIISLVIGRRTDPKLLTGITAISLVIVASIAIDYVKITQLGAVGGIERDLAIAAENISDRHFLLRWNNLTYGFNIYLGGFITSIVFLILAIVWTLKFKHDLLFDRIILSTIYILVPIFLFGDYILQTRMFLNIPIGIIISLVIYPLLVKSKPITIRRFWQSESVLLAIAIIIFGIHYLYMSFSNLVLR